MLLHPWRERESLGAAQRANTFYSRLLVVYLYRCDILIILDVSMTMSPRLGSTKQLHPKVVQQLGVQNLNRYLDHTPQVGNLVWYQLQGI